MDQNKYIGIIIALIIIFGVGITFLFIQNEKQSQTLENNISELTQTIAQLQQNEQKMTEPGTIPPPRTLFSSPIGATILAESSAKPSRLSTSKALVLSTFRADTIDALDSFSKNSSEKLSHSPHAWHWPAHLWLTKPHELQTNCFLDFFIS